MSGDLLLTFQVSQGNLETLMRILINSAGALCLSRSPGCLCSLMNLQFKSYARSSLRNATQEEAVN